MVRWVRHPARLCSHLRLGALPRSAVSFVPSLRGASKPRAAARNMSLPRDEKKKHAARRCAARVVASQRSKFFAAACRCAARVVASQRNTKFGPGIEPGPQRKKNKKVRTGNRTADLLMDTWYLGANQVDLTNAGTIYRNRTDRRTDTKKAVLEHHQKTPRAGLAPRLH